MDLLVDDPAELDGPLLAALWARAVLAADPHMVARCEAECARRGIRPARLVATTRRPLVAASKKKEETVTQHTGWSKGASTISEAVEQSKRNVKEGKSWERGQQVAKTKEVPSGKNPYRRGKGKGGGQFTSKEHAGESTPLETTDPETARTKLQEDDPSIPKTSPGGAEIEDFRDGMMIYADGTRFDGEGWRNEKGEALDDKGEVLRKPKKKKPAKSTEERDAEKAEKEAAKERERQWEAEERRRKADEAAAEGNFGPLLSLLEREETAARKARDLGDPEDQAELEAAVTKAQADLANARARAETAKIAKEIEEETGREAKREAERQARYQAVVKHYPEWEKALRTQYEGSNFTDEQWRNLIVRDRAQRLWELLHGKKATTAAAVRWDPALHPKGKDGKFIETFGLVDVFGLSGFQHGQRGQKMVQGQVTEIIPDPAKPGDPIIRVKMTDPRWDASKFGETVDVRRSQVAQRVKPKAVVPKKAPTPEIAKPAPPPSSSGQIPARTPTPNLTPHPDGPHFAPLEPPPEWATMDDPARLAWIKDRMEADLSKWRGEPTGFDFTGFEPGVAFNLANTYRDLANWDPDTARRIDNGILPSTGGSNGLSANAIAVAHPGTAHPGGIGEKIKPSAIVFGTKYGTMKFWAGQKSANAGAKVPFSTSSMTGDPTVTLIHEFGHHRQFRFLDIAMRDASKAWTDTVRDDGFGLIPDSSNWKETQALRYQIPKLSQTKYGQSKSSEGFAEGIAERALGISSPALDATFDEWDQYMGLMLAFPSDRHWETRSFDELTDAEKDQWWAANGPYLDLPGMRDHYPDSAKAYDAWKAGKPAPQATPGQKPGWMVPAADWEEDAAALGRGLTLPDGSTVNEGEQVLVAPNWDAMTVTAINPDGTVAVSPFPGGPTVTVLATDLALPGNEPERRPAEMTPAPATVTGPGGTIPLTTLSDESGQFEPGGWVNPDTTASVQSGLDRVNASYPKAPPLRTIGIRPEQTALGNKSIDTITVGSMFHDPEFWKQRQQDAWLFAGDGTPAATIFHEYAHIMDADLTSEQRKPLDAIVRAPVTYTVNGQPVTAPRWQVGSPVDYPNPSAYASESPYEFVAEALTDVEFNGDQAAPISHEIAAIFAGVFG